MSDELQLLFDRNGFDSKVEGCHGLVLWYFTFAATIGPEKYLQMQRACCRVGSHVCCYLAPQKSSLLCYPLDTHG